MFEGPASLPDADRQRLLARAGRLAGPVDRLVDDAVHLAEPPGRPLPADADLPAAAGLRLAGQHQFELRLAGLLDVHAGSVPEGVGQPQGQAPDSQTGANTNRGRKNPLTRPGCDC